MREDVLKYIYSKPDLKQFLREQPFWYRKLARDPATLEHFEIASLHYFKKTIPHQVEKLQYGLQMASMMMGMLQMMKSQDASVDT
ncbi:MAG TPA: YlbE-like family protein [Bacillaceae bacterium]